MTTIDNSKIFLKGGFTDVTVSVPAKTTLLEGTVLGFDADGALIPFNTTDCTNAQYVLAQDLANTTNSVVERGNVRAFEWGEVNGEKLIFTASGESLTAEIKANMKANGIIVCQVNEETNTL